MAVLYQKYRPQRFAEVIGQEPIVRTLQNAAAAGQLAHAYLLTGSRGIGKTTIARIIAKAANCLHPKAGEPDATCEICTAIADGNFLDVIEIDAASHTGVDNVRELIEHVQFKPSRGKTKVFIIDEVHMLSKAAFNALLKTLEEPPQHAMFILATTDLAKVPETIVSRTQKFDFRRITPQAMTDALDNIVKQEKLKLPDGTVQAIVENAEGGMRDALSLLDTAASLGKGSTTEEVRALLGLTPMAVVEELVTNITEHNSSAIPDFFAAQVSRGQDFTIFNRSVLEYLRQVLVMKLTGQNNSLPDQAEALKNHAGKFAIPELLRVIRLFLRSYKEIATAPSAELPLLLAAVEASIGSSTSAPRAAGAPAAQPISLAQTTFTPAPTSKPAPVILAEEVSEDFDRNVTKEQILEWWPGIVSEVKTINSPLATLLRNSPLVSVASGVVTISVKYLFHKENLDNHKNQTMIQGCIKKVSGKNLLFRSVINRQQTTTSQEPEMATTVDALGDALSIFGGELIE
jgi:DNA polymerase-3 subunit gamma/tau